MSETAYVGLPGSGKSYSVVEHVILPALKDGRCVVTNLPLDVELVAVEYPGADLRPFDMDLFAGYVGKLAKARNMSGRESVEAELRTNLDDAVPAGCVWVIDECWRLWPAGQKEKDVGEPFRAILAEHRHRVDEAGKSMQVVLVTQDLMQIGVFARRLVEETFRVVKLGFFGFDSRYRVDVFRGAATGQNPSEKNRTRQMFGKYQSKVWRFYKSHTMSKAGEAGADESKVDTRGVVWKRPIIWVGLAFIVLALSIGIPMVHRSFSGHGVGRNSKSLKGAPGSSEASPGRSVEPVIVKKAPVRSAWHVALDVPELGVTYLSDGDNWTQVRLPDFCDRMMDRLIVCHWHGQDVTNEFVPIPRAPVGGLGALLPVGAGTASP